MHEASADSLAQQAVDLLNEGNRPDALRICRDLLARSDISLAVLDAAVWVATTAKSTELASRLAVVAARLAPKDPQRLRTAAALLSQIGRFDEALHLLKTGHEIEPDDFDSAFMLGVAYNQVGRHRDAVAPLLRARQLRPTVAETLHQIAVAASKLGQIEAAVATAVEAYELESTNVSRAAFAGSLLRQAGRQQEAVLLLGKVRPQGDTGVHLLRLLAECLVELDRLPEALLQVDHALALKPRDAELILFRASVLARAGRPDEAALEIDAALAADPDNLPLRRHAVTLLLQAARYDAAVGVAAELLRRVPTSEEYARCMTHALAMRSDATVELPAILEKKRRAAPRRRRPPPSALDWLRTQGRVVMALLLREMRTRFGESRLGYLWVLVELGIHLGVLAIVFQFVMEGEPPMGHSFFFFYFTGLIPYLLFLHTSEQAGHGITNNRHLLQLPMVNNFNIVLARGVLELFTQLLMTALFVTGFLIAGVDALPSSVGQAFLALFFAWLLGLGCGFINAVLNAQMNAWHHVFSVVIRVLYFCSGIFYVPSAMPVGVREVLAWNPLLHCVDWFRTTFFFGYEPQWLEREYAVVCALSILLVGLLMEAAFRRKVRRPP